MDGQAGVGTPFVGEAPGMLSELEIEREGSRVGSGLRARVGLPCTTLGSKIQRRFRIVNLNFVF